MATTRSKHIVLFPFPGQGHHANFLAIARLLARLLARELPDAAITLVSTPRNVAALRSSSSAVAQAPSIGFHALPFVPADHCLPVGYESTSSLPVPSFVTLFEAFESPEPAFDDYVSGLTGRSVESNAPVESLASARRTASGSSSIAAPLRRRGQPPPRQRCSPSARSATTPDCPSPTAWGQSAARASRGADEADGNHRFLPNAK